METLIVESNSKMNFDFLCNLITGCAQNEKVQNEKLLLSQ